MFVYECGLPGRLAAGFHHTAGGGTSNRGFFDLTDILTVSDSAIRGNTPSFRGGGIYNNGSGDTTVTGSTIANNSAFRGGGGFVGDGRLIVGSSTTFASPPHH